MKLYVTTASPYARIARVVVNEKGLRHRVEILTATTRSPGSPYYTINPSGRVPYLVRDDGVGMEDSDLIGEKRTERIPLGSYDLGLPQLRRERAACEQLIEQGKSPKRYRVADQEKRRAAGMTLREALEEYWSHAIEKIWCPSTQKYNEGTRTRHLDPMHIMNMPIDSIRAGHLDQAFGKKWATMSGTGPRIRSLLHSTLQYQIDQDDGVYRGPNPVSWRKNSSLSRLLGEQLPSKPHPGLNYRDVPKVVAYFCAPMDHWVPGYLTTMQAAYAWERDPRAIRHTAGGRCDPPCVTGVSDAAEIERARITILDDSGQSLRAGG